MADPIYMMDLDEREQLYLGRTHFNIHYNISSRYQHVFDALSVSCDQMTPKEAWCIITNSARAIKYNADSISIPKHELAYRGNIQQISFTKMMRLLDAMVDNEYFIYHRGGMNFTADRPYMSIYKMTQKYLDLWVDIDTTKEIDPIPPVLIRERRTKKKLPTKGVSGVKSISDLVSRFNDRLETTEIAIGDTTACTQRYVRIYTDSIRLGGRFYNTTGEFQTTSKHRRKEILIDGSEVIELDFKSMHPSILYEHAWQESPVDVERWIREVHGGTLDPYPPVSPDIISRSSQDEDVIRNLNKFAMLVSLNAKDFRSAQLALASEWYSDVKRKNRKYGDLLFVPGLNGTQVFPSTTICRHIQEYNAPIEAALFCDAGLLLQNIEADIIGKVIDSLLSMGELLLPVHDSIIVKKDLAEYAIQMMRQSYKEIVGSDKFCMITRS